MTSMATAGRAAPGRPEQRRPAAGRSGAGAGCHPCRHAGLRPWCCWDTAWAGWWRRTRWHLVHARWRAWCCPLPRWRCICRGCRKPCWPVCPGCCRICASTMAWIRAICRTTRRWCRPMTAIPCSTRASAAGWRATWPKAARGSWPGRRPGASTLLLWAGQDRVVDPAGSAALARLAPPAVLQAQCFGPAFHEIFNERGPGGAGVHPAAAVAGPAVSAALGRIRPRSVRR
jgi:hypothetical protein